MLDFFPKASGNQRVLSGRQAYLLIWLIEGEPRFLVSHPDFLITANEFDRFVGWHGALLNVSPPKENLDLRYPPSFSGSGASFTAYSPDIQFDPDTITIGTRAELSVIFDGEDLADRLVLISGLVEESGWEENGCIRGALNWLAWEDTAFIPRGRILASTWPGSEDEFRGEHYPIIMGSGECARIPLPICDIEMDGEQEAAYRFIICEGHLPKDYEIVLELFDELERKEVIDEIVTPNPTKEWWTIPETDDNDDDVYTVTEGSDSTGNKVTYVSVLKTILSGAQTHILNRESKIFATITWNSRSKDTIGNAVENLLGRAQINIPLSKDIAAAIDAAVGDIAFDTQINAETTPLSVVADRLLPQILGCIRQNLGALSIWCLPRNFDQAGPLLTYGQEIIARTKPPTATKIENIVNTGTIKWGRNPRSEGSTLYQIESDGTEDTVRSGKLSLIGESYDSPASIFSRIQFGTRKFELSCPDLTNEKEVKGIFSRMLQWFSQPMTLASYKLKPEYNGLRAGDQVLVTDPKWGLDSAPFMIVGMAWNINGPEVELWGGKTL